MILLLITFVALVFLASIYFAPLLRKYIKEDPTEYLSYVKREHLLSEGEREFLKVLTEAAEGKFFIVPKLQLSKLVQVEKDRDWEYAPVDMTHIKSVDFALFNPDTFAPYLVIELDHPHEDHAGESGHGGHGGHGESHGASPHGKSAHGHEDTAEKADKFLGKVLNKVGIRIIHLNQSETYNVEELRELIS